MGTSIQPGSSAAIPSPYNRLIDSESPDSVLPVITKATSFLAHRLAQRGIPYEDLQQEAFLACVLAAHTFDVAGGATYSTYALHCAYNRMLDYVRRENRASKGVDSGDALIGDESNETFFDRLPRDPAFLENPENILMVSQLNAAIDHLPERERTCLQLSFFQDLTHEDISLRMGITRARVGQLVGQAIARLHRALVQ